MSSLRIAIASSGLSHVSRGVETWAGDTAVALRRAGQQVTLFQGSGAADGDWRQTLGCWQRFDRRASRVAKMLRPVGGWRFGLGNSYQIEQTTFAWKLWRRIRRDYDVLHVQDPRVALILDRLHRAGLSRPRVILAHGTEETARELTRYSFLQHLAPVYDEQWRSRQPARQFSTAIPNFVDVERFSPGEREAARARWELQDAGLAVLCVAALKKHHKRCDYVIREFQRFLNRTGAQATLMMVGARERETDEVMELGRSLLGERVRFVVSAPRTELPSLYRAADAFCLGSLHEMMPIAVLEALASGLPVMLNGTPTMCWMGGEAGLYPDMAREGALAAAFQRLATADRDMLETLRKEARRRAVSVFSEAAVVPQTLAMYDAVMRWSPAERRKNAAQQAKLTEVKG